MLKIDEKTAEAFTKNHLLQFGKNKSLQYNYTILTNLTVIPLLVEINNSS